MRNKPADIKYYGVNSSKIRSSNPDLNEDILAYAYEWMRDRYNIHVKKDVEGLPAPWTDNPILRQVKFCNVRREHDRQSRNLIDNITSNPGLTVADKMFNCVLFRMFNMWEPLHAMGGPWTIKQFAEIDLDDARKRLEEFEANGGKVFTNAFNTGGLKQCLAFPEMAVHGMKESPSKMMVNVRRCLGNDEWIRETVNYKVAKKLAQTDLGRYTIDGWEAYMPMRVVRFLKQYLVNYPHYFDTLLENSNEETPGMVYECLRQDIEGLGPFLAYQIWVDFTYIEEYPFSENEFTIAGPGCKTGIDLLFRDKDWMTYEECIFWLRDNQYAVFGDLGYDPETFWSAEKPWDKCMNVMQLENMFCELQKYTRCKEAVARGEKPRGKVGYDGLPGQKAVPVFSTPKTSTNLMAKFLNK